MSERNDQFIRHPAPVLIMTVAVFLLSLAARAATVTGFSDIMSRNQVSTAANHEIKFVTPTGVQATSDTIALVFASGFTMGSVSFDDMDFAVDTSVPTTDCGGTFTEETVAASAAAGVWGAAVSGTTVTLTPPTDAAVGEVPAGDCVRLRIGTNATVGTAGDHQITNPSVTTENTLSLTGAFGDSGLAYLYLNDSDQVTITATVPDSGGGPPPPPPPAAPVISNVHVNNITETTADVLWDTDIASSSTVNYGTTISYGSDATGAGPVFNHTVSLSGLTPGTLYHYRVRSTGTGPEAVSGDFTFTTLDTTAPVLSNIQAVDITGTTARITWDTDEDTDSRVDYGIAPGPPYSNFVFNGTLTNAHSLTLTSLTPNTLYRFRVTSKDASTNTTTSIEFTFQTLDTVPPGITGITVTNITTSSARVDWSTDELADSRVDYGTTVAYGSTVFEAPAVANHQVPLSGLAPNTLYHFRVSSHDASGNGATSTDQTFTTLPDTTPPANVTGLTVTPSNQQNALAWTNPGDSDFSGVRVQRSTTSFPASPTSGTTVFDGLASAFLDTGLTNGTTYFYTVFAYDSSGNFASGTVGSGTPFDSVPPGPVTGFVVSPGDSLNGLSWTNPADADFSNVVLRRSTVTFPPGPNDGDLVYNGNGTNFTDTGLTNGTTYYYSIFARDTSGNHSTGVQGSGTPAATSPPPPVCGDSLCQAPEDATSCPADCAVGPVCGNAVCESPETNSSCPADCPPAPPPPPSEFCGNGICAVTEDNASCPADCPAPPVPPVVPPPQTGAGDLDASLIRYYAVNRTITLSADVDGFYHILPLRTLSVVVPDAALPQQVTSMTLNFGPDSYLFARETGGYGVDVSAPGSTGLVSGTIIVTYADGTTDLVPFEVRVEGFGQVRARQDGRDVPLEGVTLTVYHRVNPFVVWDATPYLQANPVSSPANGALGYMVPTGEYYVKAEKDGYRTNETPPALVDTQVLNPDIEMLELPQSILEVIVPGASVIENVGNVARATGEQTAYFAKVVQKEIIEDPRVRKATTNVVVPVAAIVTTAVVVTAVQAGAIVNYIYFLITQPLLLLGRRKRKEYGIVYNSLTKLPVDLAIVRLFRISNNRLVRTIVTDKQGRYAFLVEPGEYRLEATKQNYVFPSEYLKDRREDLQYLDLYHGETVRVGTEGAIITANIPMDPVELVKSNRRLVLEDVARKFQNFLAPLSVYLTIAAFVFYREVYLAVLVVVQLGLYFLFRRLARPKQPKNWGIVYDETTKKPIPFAITRIVETQYNKILESRISDSRGRYNFLVGNNKYYVTVEKPGYDTSKTADIDLTTKEKGGGVVSVDVPLRPKKKP